MNRTPHNRLGLGNEPPLIADRRRRPERRQVSARWLAGTLLTGLTSTALMGIALSAALDGRQVMPGAAIRAPEAAAALGGGEKGERVFAAAIPAPRHRRTLDVSTMIRDGDREVIRTLPFAYVDMTLAARHPTTVSYPKFDPLKVFASEEEPEPSGASETGLIYGAKVETEVSLKVEPFRFDEEFYDASGELQANQAETLVREASLTLSYDAVQVASLNPLDPFRFELTSDAAEYEPGSAFRIIEENVSVALPDERRQETPRFTEEIIPFRETMGIVEALAQSGYEKDDATKAAGRVAELLSTQELQVGLVLRVGVEHEDGEPRLVRLSVYRGHRHVVTVAQDDRGEFEPAAAPTMSRAVLEAFDENATEAPLRTDMPTAYDGIYRAALAYGLNQRLCEQLIRMLASEVDYGAKLQPTDRLKVFYSLEDGQQTASEGSEILYVEAKFGDATKRYYRFRNPDDNHVDFYDEEGRSAKQFLLRNPVPNGRFTSAFGTRRHPVLGYKRAHWGVDWAAPRGTPIIASGSGTVEQAGWSSGYGRQTILRHPNGYETSYSHQSAIAKGVVPGAKVRQGQIIGYVGSTGLSTGNHLHYEVSVNGKKVDPMRIRLPSGRVLQGEQLAAFRAERERIDALLEDSDAAIRTAGR